MDGWIDEEARPYGIAMTKTQRQGERGAPPHEMGAVNRYGGHKSRS